MLNEYVWQLYMTSDGRDTVEFFRNCFKVKFDNSYGDRICAFHKNYCPSHEINRRLHEELAELNFDLEQGTYLLEPGEYSIESALQVLYDVLKTDDNTSDKEIFINFSDGIEYYSTLLSVELPDIFVPYYFFCNFNVFEKIALEFDISIPPVPCKKDYIGRYHFYGELCAVLYDFRRKQNMLPYELWAFLYDFGPKYIGGIDSYIVHDLPAPNSAYFVGGSDNDAFITDDLEEAVCWQASPETLVGDAIVLYLRSPISAIDSIWRSVSVGFNDPFFYYYRCTYISKRRRIKRIPHKELVHNEIFKELPIVKKNMQGINGVEILPSVYNYLIQLSNIDVPSIEAFGYCEKTPISREKDVENLLVKPLIAKLGYLECEYCQQLVIRIGNHQNKLIPDFVIHPRVTTGHQSADYIIEAKFSITTMRELEDAKIQARSYAKLLNAKYSVIAAKEGIWITSKSDDYSENVLHYLWEELKIEDNFYKIFTLIGNSGKMNKEVLG